MPIKEKFLYYLKGIGGYFEDSLLLFIKPKSTIKKIREKPFSIKLFLVNIFLITIIHSIFNFLVAIKSLPWHIVNTIGLTWQIFVFTIFVISFSPFLIDYISSKITGIKNQLYPLSKVYLHVLIIFALYPLINLFLGIFGVPFNFLLPFATRAGITVGQIFEGVLISLISIFIIYYFYHSLKAVLISILMIGLSFPLILYGIDFVYYVLMSYFYGFARYGIMQDPAHIILWCMENMWFILLILGFGLSYFLYQKRNYFKFLTKPQIILNILFSLLILSGYMISGFILPIPQLISLIISSIAAWNFVILVFYYYNNSNQSTNKLILNKWETFIAGFWLLTTTISFSLVVSFISTFFLSLFLFLSLIFIKYFQSISKFYYQKFFIFISLYLILLMGSIPNYIFVFESLPSELAIEWPTLFSFWIGIPIAAIPSLFLKSSYFYPP